MVKKVIQSLDDDLRNYVKDSGIDVKLLGTIQTKTATITAGTSLSTEINLSGQKYFSIEMPTSWTTASITLQASSISGSGYKSVYDDSGQEVTIPVSANQIIAIDLNAIKFASLPPYILFRSGTSTTPINQVSSAAIKVHCIG